MVRGYVLYRRPTGFAPRLIGFSGSVLASFPEALAMTSSEDVIGVATPGHTPGHVSVLVRTGDISYFLAGDASYTERTLLARIPDGVTVFPQSAVKTLNDILAYAHNERTVYLPSHDPEAEQRLQEKRIVLVPQDTVSAGAGSRRDLCGR